MNNSIKLYNPLSGGGICKIIFTFAVLLMLGGKVAAQDVSYPYSVFSDGTLTFYYDDKQPDGAYLFGNVPEKHLEITKVVFDESFADYKPTSFEFLFYSYSHLREIIDMENYLNTENVTNMGYMFSGCSSLTTVDVSNFNTGNVTNMQLMFFSCSSLTTLDVSHFNTEKVTDMNAMFCYCSSLTALDVNNFNTEEVTNMNSMFAGCSSIATLDVSNFNTKNVTDMSDMFGCSSLTALDVSNFNTEKVTNMGGMFSGCSSITALDVTNFNTEIVTDMCYMFYGCSSLITLDISNFNTEYVTDMKYMFCDCPSLTNIDVSKFNTEKVTDMGSMFHGCSSLTTLDISKFNTEKVTDMGYMFHGCSSLTTLDIRNFDTGKVTFMNFIFEDCHNLTTILVDKTKWNTLSSPDGGALFLNSPNLIGNAGTQYDHSHTDVDYAHIDEGESNPGYLTTESYKVFYDLDGDGKIDDITTVDWDGATPPTSFALTNTPELSIPNPINKKGLKFKGWYGTPITGLTEDDPQTDISIPAGAVGNRIYTAVWEDNEKEAYGVFSDGTLTFYYDENKPENAYPFGNVDELKSEITKVVFDESFADYRPTSLNSLFEGYENLTEIVDMEKYLHTEDVTNMGYMFWGCSSLTTLDVSKFNTANVTYMGAMFSACSSLTTLDVSKFNTANVTYMHEMFLGCSSLTTLDVSNFNTANVTSMRGMFWDCSSLTTLDVSYFNTENVTDMRYMFNYCSSLTTLDVSKFNTENVTDMGYMFSACSSLTTLDVSNFNTANVTNMGFMFFNCSNLTTLDVSKFNTANVTDMRDMFADCDNLSTILVSEDNWNTDKVSSNPSDYDWYRGPFESSPNLIGNAGTKYDEFHTDIDYAHIDEGESNPGYLTTESYKVFYDLDGGTWNGIEPPNSFALDLNESIKIPEPKKKGYKFLGWTGTLASGISSENPTTNVSITPDKLGNRIYTAHWEEDFNNNDKPALNLPQTLSFPAIPQQPESFCQGDEKSAILKFTPTGITVTDYELTIADIITSDAHPAMDMTINGKDTTYTIKIDIPENQTPGVYHGTIKLFAKDNPTPYEESVTVEVAAAKDIVLYLYEDVIFVDNCKELYQKDQWQWYKNGSPIKNANRQFYFERPLNGSYMAEMKSVKDGLTVYSCPVVATIDLSKNATQPVKSYPNPAVSGQPVSLYIVNYNADHDYTISLSNSNGVIVNTIPHAPETSVITLPRGIYSGALISGGSKKGFKLIVR